MGRSQWEVDRSRQGRGESQLLYVIQDDESMPGLTVELASCLRRQGVNTLLVDENSIPNHLAAWLNLSTRYDLAQVLSKDCSLAQAMVKVADHLYLVSAARLAAGSRRSHFLLAQAPFQLARHAFQEQLDCCLIQTKSHSALTANHYGRQMHVLLLVKPDETLVPYIAQRVDQLLNGIIPLSLSLVMSGFSNAEHAQRAYQNLARIWSQYSIFPTPEYLGWLPEEPKKLLAVSMRLPLTEVYPALTISRSIQGIAAQLFSIFKFGHSAVMPAVEHRIAEHAEFSSTRLHTESE